MREVVSNAFLRLAISARLPNETMGPGTFWATPIHCARRTGGPNWRNRGQKQME